MVCLSRYLIQSPRTIVFIFLFSFFLFQSTQKQRTRHPSQRSLSKYLHRFFSFKHRLFGNYLIYAAHAGRWIPSERTTLLILRKRVGGGRKAGLEGRKGGKGLEGGGRKEKRDKRREGGGAEITGFFFSFPSLIWAFCLAVYWSWVVYYDVDQGFVLCVWCGCSAFFILVSYMAVLLLSQWIIYACYFLL